MEPLTRLEEDGDKQECKGAGAESWKSNDDGTVWKFHLRVESLAEEDYWALPLNMLTVAAWMSSTLR